MFIGRKHNVSFRSACRGQTAAEFLIFTSVAVLVIFWLLSVGNNQAQGMEASSAEFSARLATQRIGDAAKQVYSQGRNSRVYLQLALPSNYNASQSRINGTSVVIHAGGTDYVVDAGIPLSGSLPASPGVWTASVENMGYYVQIGNDSIALSAGQLTIYLLVNSSGSADFRIANNYPGTALVNITLPDIDPRINLSCTGCNVFIPAGKETAVNITATSSNSAAGSYTRQAQVATTYSGYQDVSFLPITVEVSLPPSPPSNETLAATYFSPPTVNMTIEAGRSYSQNFTICAPSANASMNVSFSSYGNSSGWLSNVAPEAGVAPQQCFYRTVTITPPNDTEGYWASSLLMLVPEAIDGAVMAFQVYIPSLYMGPISYSVSQSSTPTPTSVPTPIPTCDPSLNLINGDFETPYVTDSSGWYIYNQTTTKPNDNTTWVNWSIAWISNITKYPYPNGTNATRPTVANLEYQDTAAYRYSGHQFAELDADWGGPDDPLSGEPASVRIWQTLNTTPGKNYTVSFAFTPRTKSSTSDNALDILYFYWNNNLTANISGFRGTSTNWTVHTYILTANSTSTNITLADGGIPDSLGTFVDAVSACTCSETPASTPTPTLVPPVLPFANVTVSCPILSYPPNTTVVNCSVSLDSGAPRQARASDGAFDSNSETAQYNYVNITPGSHTVGFSCANNDGLLNSTNVIVYGYGAMAFITNSSSTTLAENNWITWLRGRNGTLANWSVDVISLPSLLNGSVNLTYFLTSVLSDYPTNGSLAVSLSNVLGNFTALNRTVVLLSDAVASGPWYLGLSTSNGTSKSSYRVNITNNTNYITSPYPLGSLNVLSSNATYYYNNLSMALDASRLADAMYNNNNSKLTNQSVLWVNGSFFGWGIGANSSLFTANGTNITIRVIDSAITASRLP